MSPEFPEMFPVPVGLYFTYMVVFATVPDEGVNTIAVEEYDALTSVKEILKLVGGVIVIAFVPRFIPPTIKFWEVSLLLLAAILGNAVSEVVLSEIAGTAVAVTVLLGMLIETVEAPELDNVKSPVYGLDATVVLDCILTYTVVAVIVPDVPIVNGALLVPIVVEKSAEVATSNPEGGVTKTPAFMSDPEILIDWATDGFPSAVVKVNSEPV